MRILIGCRRSGKTSWLIDNLRKTVLEGTRYGKKNRLLTFQVHNMAIALDIRDAVVRNFEDNENESLIVEKSRHGLVFANNDRLVIFSDIPSFINGHLLGKIEVCNSDRIVTFCDEFDLIPPEDVFTWGDQGFYASSLYKTIKPEKHPLIKANKGKYELRGWVAPNKWRIEKYEGGCIRYKSFSEPSDTGKSFLGFRFPSFSKTDN